VSEYWVPAPAVHALSRERAPRSSAREVAGPGLASAQRSYPAELEPFTLDELREALREKRRQQVVALRAEREETVRALRAINSELEALTGVRPRDVLAAAHEPQGEAGATMAESHLLAPATPRPTVRIGTLILKALAARYPGQATAAELVAELRTRIIAPRPEGAIAKTLGGMRAKGLIHGSTDDADVESYVLTHLGLERAGER
jgi:hypothetical protein